MIIKLPVDKAVCLVLDKRYDSWYNIRKDFLVKCGIEPDLFLAGDGELIKDSPYSHLDINSLPPLMGLSTDYPTWWARPNAYNAYLCHKKIIEEALTENVQNLMIIEDDVIVENDVNAIMEEVLDYLNDKPWDMLYLGHYENGRSVRVTPKLKRLFGSGGFHGVIIKNKLFEEILSYGPIGPMDNICGRFIHDRYKCYAVYPCVVSQISGFSYVEQNYLEKPTRYK